MNSHYPDRTVPVQATRDALVAHRYTRCRTSQYYRTFILLSVSLWNDLADPVFDGVGPTGFKSRAKAFLLTQTALSLLLSSTVFLFLFFLSISWYCGAGVFGLISYIADRMYISDMPYQLGCPSLSLSLALPTSFNNNNNNNNNNGCHSLCNRGMTLEAAQQCAKDKSREH